MQAKQLYITVPPIGIGQDKYDDGFTYDANRPARHCGICGASYQPRLARLPNYSTSRALQYEVEQLLIQWANWHNNRHSMAEHVQYMKSGNLMTPEAAIKLIPLGIYPLADLVLDDEVMQAGFEAKRSPSDDVPNR